MHADAAGSERDFDMTFHLTRTQKANVLPTLYITSVCLSLSLSATQDVFDETTLKECAIIFLSVN